MRSFAKFCLVLAGILLVISTVFQLLALFSVTMVSDHPAAVFADNPWLVPVWAVALGLLPVGFILTIVLREKGNWLIIPLVLSLVGALLALIAALALKDGLSPQINGLGNTQGLTAWKLWYRHLSSVVSGGLSTVAAVLHLFACRSDRRRREEEGYKPIYNLGGKAVFKDANSTIGLETFADESDPTARPMKRSVRRALQKAMEKNS